MFIASDYLILVVILYFCYVLLFQQPEDKKFQDITDEIEELKRSYRKIQNNSKEDFKVLK